jgi:glycosyltransferase involved in cell wall biosynthesis
MKNIIYIGQFKDASGYANAARGYLRILDQFLDRTKFNLKTLSLNFEKEDYSSGIDKELIEKYELLNPSEFIKNEKYIILLHGLPNFCFLNTKQFPIFEMFQNKNCIKKVNLVAWETDIVPQPWMEIYKKNIFDELVVFCNWNKQVFEQQTGLKASVAYHPITDFDSTQKPTNKLFRILSMSQWQHRKGFDILLRAYYQEFFDHDDVELFIKTYRSETTKGFSAEHEKNIVVDEIRNYKNEITHYGTYPKCKVLLKTGFSSKEEIIDLYNKSDVFCTPTRGEAFGLTIAQAAMSGLPCIVPDKGGHLDYLDPQSTYFISSSWEPAYHMPFPVYSCKDMNLVEPSLSSTRKQMRKAYEDWKNGNLTEKSVNAKKYTESVLQNKNIFKNLIEVLGE